MMWGRCCMTKYYPKEHDILKLCNNYTGSKIHYCPDNIGAPLLEQIKTINGFRALKHHCVFRWKDKKHCCNWQDFYRITKEDFFLAIADTKASAISRKLNIGFSRKGAGKHERIIWDTYHVWINNKINECKGKEPNDLTIVSDVLSSKDIATVFANRTWQIKKRSEDAWQCPFASLMTHSELTEKWFNFFIKNNDYFRVPDQIKTISEAKEISASIQGNNSKKNYKKGLSITFVRLKFFANQNLSRIADTEIIQNIGNLVRAVPNHFKNAQELYTLYDEIIFTIAEPQKDLKTYIEECLHAIKEFTTNYYCEGNYATARLINTFSSKELLVGYDKLFQEFQYTFYPILTDRLDPKPDDFGGENIEAYSAKLCELCNMAGATRTFWKFNDEEEKIHECLCEHCFKIRDNQKKINEAIKEGKDILHGIGYKIAIWEDKKPDSKLCFIKIDLNLTILNDLLKKILINEFPLKTPTEKYNDENIGFSIVYEFLTHYNEFLASFKEAIYRLENFNSNANKFQILDNFICLRFDEMADMKDVVRIFVETYLRFFPQFTGLHDSKNHDSKNKNDFPITFSATIANIKFPFFEAWRYSNLQKENLINILAVRKFELVMDYREYQHLRTLDFNGKRISSFLHKLVEIEGKTGSAILINTEIFNNKNSQNEIFHGISKHHYDIMQLINFFKLIRS